MIVTFRGVPFDLDDTLQNAIYNLYDHYERVQPLFATRLFTGGVVYQSEITDIPLNVYELWVREITQAYLEGRVVQDE